MNPAAFCTKKKERNDWPSNTTYYKISIQLHVSTWRRRNM